MRGVVYVAPQGLLSQIMKDERIPNYLRYRDKVFTINNTLAAENLKQRSLGASGGLQSLRHSLSRHQIWNRVVHLPVLGYSFSG